NNTTTYHPVNNTNTTNINLLLEKAFFILKRLVYLKWKYLINNTLIDTFIETVRILEEKFYFLDFLIKKMNKHFIRIFNTQITKNTLSFSFNPLYYIKYFPCYYDTSIVIRSIEISFIKALFQYFKTIKYSLVNKRCYLLKSVHNICLDTLFIEPSLEMCFNIYSVIFKGSLLTKIYNYYRGVKGNDGLEGVNDKDGFEGVSDRDEGYRGVNAIGGNIMGVSNNVDNYQGVRDKDGLEGVNEKDSLEGVSNNVDEQQGVNDKDGLEGVNDIGSNIMGVSNNVDEQQGVRDKDGFECVNEKDSLEGVSNNVDEQQGVSNNTNKQQGVNYNVDDYKDVSNNLYKQHPLINTLIEEIIELVLMGYLQCKDNIEFLRNEVLVNYSYFIEVESQMNKILLKDKSNDNTFTTSTYTPYINTPLSSNTHTLYSNTPLATSTYTPNINTPLSSNTHTLYSNTPLATNTYTPYINTPLSSNIPLPDILLIFLKGVNDLRIILDYLSYINKRCYLYNLINNNEIPLFTFKILNNKISIKECYKNKNMFINRSVNTFIVIYNTLESILREITYEPYNLYVLYDLLEIEDFIYKISVIKEVSSVIIKEIKSGVSDSRDIVEGVNDRRDIVEGVRDKGVLEGTKGVSYKEYELKGVSKGTDNYNPVNNLSNTQHPVNNLSINNNILTDNTHVLFINKYNTINTLLITISNRIKMEKKRYFDLFYNNSSNVDNINVNDNTPLSNSNADNTPLSNSNDDNTPLSNCINPNTPLTNCINPDTPLTNSINPNTPLSNCINPDTPLTTITTNNTPLPNTLPTINNTTTLSLPYINTLTFNTTTSYKSIINTLFTYNYNTINNTYEFLYKLKDNLLVLEYKYLIIKKVRNFLRLEEYLLIYRNIDFNTLKYFIYNIYSFIVNIKNKEEGLNEYENNSLRHVSVNYMKGICSDMYKEIKGMGLVLDSGEGVSDNRKGVNSRDRDSREGVSDNRNGFSSRDSREGVDHSSSNYKGFSKHSSNFKGVNDTSSTYKGVSESTYKQHPFNNTNIEQHPLNNTTYKQHPFNNNNIEQHPFNNNNIEQHPFNPNLSTILNNISLSLSFINLRLLTYFKVLEYLNTIINTNIGIRYFNMNMSLKCFISIFNEEVVNKIITYYKVESDINSYKRDVNLYISNVVLVREIGIEGVSNKVCGLEGVNDNRMEVGGVNGTRMNVGGVNNNRMEVGGVTNSSNNYRGLSNRECGLEGVTNSTNTYNPLNNNTTYNPLTNTTISYINKICNLKEIEEYLDDLYVKGEGLEKYIFKIKNELKGFKEEVLYSYNKEGGYEVGGVSESIGVGGGVNESIDDYKGVSSNTYSYKGVNGSIDDYKGVSNNRYNYKGVVNESIDDYKGVSNDTNEQQGFNKSTNEQQGVNNNTYDYHPVNTNINNYHPVSNTYNNSLIDSLFVSLRNTLNTLESYLYIIRELKGIQSTLIELYSILKNNTLETENINKIIEVYNLIGVSDRSILEGVNNNMLEGVGDSSILESVNNRNMLEGVNNSSKQQGVNNRNMLEGVNNNSMLEGV
ncbi:hypothetical protein CWI38_1881p0010, partial [Hamiltosporidium tvaerminnensis]